MGGHGALTLALKNPGMYQSVSAFAPICNPINCPWGVKGFENYLGSVEAGKAYDATELVASYSGPPMHMLIDQGIADNFFKQKQLLPENFMAAAAKNAKVKVDLRMQDGYDHGYTFIATFMGDHIAFHAETLNASSGGGYASYLANGAAQE